MGIDAIGNVTMLQAWAFKENRVHDEYDWIQ